MGQFQGQQDQLRQEAALANQQQQFKAAMQQQALRVQGILADKAAQRKISKDMAENTAGGFAGGLTAAGLGGGAK